MNSFMREMPGPLVGVKARAPFQAAPMTMPMAESSSSACTMQYLFLPVSLSTRNSSQYSLKASMREVEGVMGYQAPTVAPANTQPRPDMVLPSTMMWPAVLSMASSFKG